MYVYLSLHFLFYFVQYSATNTLCMYSDYFDDIYDCQAVNMNKSVT